jgi:hypothetical protein
VPFQPEQQASPELRPNGPGDRSRRCLLTRLKRPSTDEEFKSTLVVDGETPSLAPLTS